MRSLICYILIVLAGAPSYAQGPSEPDDVVIQVEALARRASAAYKRGEYESAIRLYLRAYALRETAAILYNVAVVYDRKLNDVARAQRFYRRYISSDDTDRRLSLKAEARLDLFAERENTAQRQLNLNGRQDGLSKSGLRGGMHPEPLNDSRKAPVFLLWSGGGLLVAGGVYWGLAHYESKRFSRSRELADKKRLRESAETNALVGDVVGGVGGVAMITGLIWYLATAPEDAPMESLTVIPSVDGVSIQGVF